MQHLKKFTKNSGQIIRYYEIFIPKNGGKIKTQYKEMPVLLTCDNNVVVYGQYSRLELLDIKKKKGQDGNSVIGNPKAYVRNWGESLFSYNGLCAHIYSYQTEYMVKKRVHNAIQKLIAKEYGAYTSMSVRLEHFLRGEL